MTNFVSEMKTKSPAVVQRWVDSLPNENVTELVDDKEQLSDDRQLHSNNENNSIDDHTDEKNSFDINSSSIQKTDCKLNSTENLCELKSVTETIKINQTIDSNNQLNSENNLCDKRFWRKGHTILSALRRKSQIIETDDLNTIVQFAQPNETTINQPNEITITTSMSSIDEPSSSTNTTFLNKTKLNEFYDKLGISKKRYNYFKERKMEAKKIINNAKTRFTNSILTQQMNNDIENTINSGSDQENNLDVSTTAIVGAEESSSIACAESIGSNAIGMDISTDEFSRLSHSNDLLLVDDDEDSFNVSMPSINDGGGGSSSHLNINRKIGMADIGRSTSDNPRLRNKFYLGDIGRSFSERQDDDSILIGERNISAPSSSISIQNNNRSNSNFFERRAYSVSPTQRNLKRGILSREQSLSDSSRHRHQLSKGSSFQSDSSHCSSVESLLDARKPDPEAILRQLGFGPAYQENLLSRIPKR